jgi:rod shape-determining protein MreC
VRIGYAVINGDGLVGRTVDAGASVARVLLLNDLNSRIPVLVGPAGVRALASGDNSAELRLDFLPDGAQVYPGDEVYTSGSDGVFPRGLHVGVVTGSSGTFKVRPHAELSSLDVVSVLYFDTPTLVTTTDPPSVADSRALSASPNETPPAPTLQPTVSNEAAPVEATVKQTIGSAEVAPPVEAVKQTIGAAEAAAPVDAAVKQAIGAAEAAPPVETAVKQTIGAAEAAPPVEVQTQQ